MNVIDRINQLARERQELWRAAGQNGGLKQAERERVRRIEAQLARLWDERRKWLAGWLS